MEKTIDSRTKLLAAEKMQSFQEKSRNTEVKLQVIGAGLPRTATTSLKAALEILGFGPVLHDHGGQLKEFTHLVEAKTTQLKSENLKQSTLIGRTSSHPKTNDEKYAEKHAQTETNLRLIEKASNVSLSDLIHGYVSVVDSPIMDFFPELLHLHPNAHVILSVRDSDAAWWKSYYYTIGKVVEPGWRGWLLRVFIWPVREDAHILGDRVTELWGVRYGVRWGERIHSKHTEIVRKEVEERGGRLLIWNPKEGWPRLCEFLGVEIPDVEFPRMNDTKQMQAFVSKKYRLAAWFWAAVVLAIAWVIYLVLNSDGSEEFRVWRDDLWRDW